MNVGQTFGLVADVLDSEDTGPLWCYRIMDLLLVGDTIPDQALFLVPCRLC